MSFTYLTSILPAMLEGLRTTILLLVIAWVVGHCIAVGIGLARTSHKRRLRWSSWLYIELIRGTPLLVQMYLLYYGLGSVLGQTPEIRGSFIWPYLRDGFWYAVLALGISTGAYSGEILRGALRAVPRGEVEAARALGLRGGNLVRLILLPRAIQPNLPTLAGETVILLKSTALASTITVLDVMGQANYARAQSLRFYEPLLVAAVAYVLLTLVITQLFALAERRYGPARTARTSSRWGRGGGA